MNNRVGCGITNSTTSEDKVVAFYWLIDQPITTRLAFDMNFFPGLKLAAGLIVDLAVTLDWHVSIAGVQK